MGDARGQRGMWHLMLLVLALLAGCRSSPLDGDWRCAVEKKKTLDLHRVSFDYTVTQMSRTRISGSRLELGEGSRPIEMKLVAKATAGRSHFVEATSVTPMPVPGPPVGFLFELGPDGQSLTISELKDVDWSKPATAARLHPVRCTRR